MHIVYSLFSILYFGRRASALKWIFEHTECFFTVVQKEAPVGASEHAMAGYAGLEPAASDVTGRRSNQLS